MMMKLFWVSNFSFGLSISLSKISALLFYARIFGFRLNPDRNFRIAWCIIFAIVVAWMVWDVTYEIVQCSPPQKFYEPLTPGHCLNLYESYVLNAVSSVIIDLMILLLPLPPLWRLRMNKGKRIQVTLVFISGYASVLPHSTR